MKSAISNCCGADMRVEGGVTQFFVCRKCGRACDAVERERRREVVDYRVPEYTVAPVAEPCADEGKCGFVKPSKNGFAATLAARFFDAHKIHAPQFEFRFHPPRKWRFDIAWPEQRVAVEVQGGIWTAGRHNRGAAMLKEWEKLNTAACDGWRILYVQPRDLMTAEFAAVVKKALI